MSNGQKECNICNEVKPLDEFDINRCQCKLCLRKRRIRYENQNEDILREYQANYYQANKTRKKADRKKYVKNNREKINKAERDKRKNNINFRLACNLRLRIRTVIGRNQKSGSAIGDLGCSVDELKCHLEKQFYSNSNTKEKMTWDNYGLYGWHIDHIIPLSSFDLTDRKQFLEACHYTNLQPLWAEDNLSKGNKQQGERNVK